jgi:hypothetical protein
MQRTYGTVHLYCTALYCSTIRTYDVPLMCLSIVRRGSENLSQRLSLLDGFIHLTVLNITTESRIAKAACICIHNSRGNSTGPSEVVVIHIGANKNTVIISVDKTVRPQQPSSLPLAAFQNDVCTACRAGGPPRGWRRRCGFRDEFSRRRKRHLKRWLGTK